MTIIKQGIVARLRENVRIFKQVRACIDAERIIEMQRAIDEAAANASVTPEKVAHSLRAIGTAYEYVRRDHIAQEMGLDVDLMLSREILSCALLVQAQGVKQ